MVRGANHNGRRTLLGAIAREVGLGLLEVNASAANSDDRWRLAGPLSTALHALPVIVFDLAPQEIVEVRHLSACAAPYGIVAGNQGGGSGDGVDGAVKVCLEFPYWM